MIREYPIEPVPKPRMTRGDKYQKTPRGLRYRAFKEECKIRHVRLPESGYHVTFILPMPKSWPEEKRQAMNGQPHQQKPDKDNLEKALLDAVFNDDSRVWDGRVTKLWGVAGKIIIETND